MATLTQKKVFASLPRAERGKAVKLTGRDDKFLYCNGNSVYIRSLKNPLEVDIYTEHSKSTTIARYSPSGYYIASGDTVGKIRIWDTINPEHILKKEYPVLGGEIRDITWSEDSQKIAVGGDGREKFAHVFNMDTGTSVGELIAVSKMVNTVALRQQRPFRLVAASEDMKVIFYEGPPFKYKRTQTCHTNFVNVARYAPDGSLVISGGADAKLFKYEGKDLELIGEMGSKTHKGDEMGSKAHKGGVYEICFSSDGKEILTASGDKTAKIFDVESEDCVCTFNMDTGKDPKTAWHNMQLGALWQSGEILTVNGLGHLIFQDRNNPDQPKRVIKGHMKPITALALSEDKKTAFTGGQEGIFHWDVESGDNDQVCGKGHTNQVTDMVVDNDNLISVGVDDTLRVTSVSSKDFSDIEVTLDSQPSALDCRNGTVVVVCVNHIIVLEGERSKGFKKRLVQDIKKEPASVSIHPDGSTIAVGFKGKEIGIYSLQGASLSQKQSVKVTGEVSCLAFSPDGSLLAHSSDKCVSVRNTADYELVSEPRQTHTARVCCLAWSPDSDRLASGALDSMLIVWKKNMVLEKRPTIKAHAMSHINKLAWLDPNTVITVGQDSNVKQFTVSSE